MDLEQSSAAYYICTVTSWLLLSLEDILLRTLLPVITVVMPAKGHSFMNTLIALTFSYLNNVLLSFVFQVNRFNRFNPRPSAVI